MQLRLTREKIETDRQKYMRESNSLFETKFYIGFRF